MGLPNGSSGQNGLVPGERRQTRAGLKVGLGGLAATGPHTQPRGGPRATADARAASRGDLAAPTRGPSPE